MEFWVIVLLVVGGLIALWLCWAAFIGALALFAFAGEQGFIGIAAYIACWVFLFPVMLVVCIVVGIVVMFSN